MRAGADGVFVAAPMWHRFMELALAGQPALDFAVPDGIVQIAYDPGSNKPATRVNKNTRMEPFPWYALPKEAKISAAPKSLNKGLLTPVSEPIIPTPLTAPSTLPPSIINPTPTHPTVPGIWVPDTWPTLPSQTPAIAPTTPDVGGLPESPLLEVNSANRPVIL
jgi:hypothetical protein